MIATILGWTQDSLIISALENMTPVRLPAYSAKHSMFAFLFPIMAVLSLSPHFNHMITAVFSLFADLNFPAIAAAARMFGHNAQVIQA